MEMAVTVTVKNTGNIYSGKEVVQIYYSAPQGRLEKPYQELAAYAKTKELMPGESETLTIAYPFVQMASYDPERASYIMESGVYYVRVGNHSRNTKVAAAICLDEEAVTEVLSNRLMLDCPMDELSAKDVVPYTYEGEAEEKRHAAKIYVQASDLSCKKAVYHPVNPVIPVPDCKDKIRMTDVLAGDASLDDLVGQLTIEEMADLCVGTAREGVGAESIIGAASMVSPGAAGDTTSSLIADRNVMNMVLADGPAGLRLAKEFKTDRNGRIIPESMGEPFEGWNKLFDHKADTEMPEDAAWYYQYCTAIPIATLLAQTWDAPLIQEAGRIVGEEMVELGVTLWLAPGMNIQRNPLGARNFEYYSEDPLVSGLCAAAATLGVQQYSGIGTTIKHLAFNNQEDNRMHSSAHIGERAIREIYLKGFEIAVKAAQPMAVMTSYNLINGIHTANSYDLVTAILRNEWGFQGLVMTDWGTTGNGASGKMFKYGSSDAAECIRAGNDLIMPGSFSDVRRIIESVNPDTVGNLPVGDLQACAKHILSIIMQCCAYESAVPYKAVSEGIEHYICVKC